MKNKIVICIDNENGYLAITIDKEYEINEDDIETNEYYYLTNDQGDRRIAYLKSRFKIKEMKPKLNLADKTQNWCVKGDASLEMSKALRKYSLIDNRSNSGAWVGTGDHYYGVYEGIQYNSRFIKGYLYSKEEFLKAFEEFENPWIPKVGELVEVSDENKENQYRKQTFIAKTENGFVTTPCKGFYPGGFISYIWKYMRKIEPKVEISISCKVNGVEKDPKDFSEKDWLAFRNNS